MRGITCLLSILFLSSLSFAQQQPDVAQIKQKLKKLNVLTSVLYVAAHPDDENTRIISLMANDKLAETAYLSMTRGDGGQNLIGPEIRDLLGLIRTQELLAARRIDGGQQFFTRAIDFGFSKSSDETFKIWNKDEILSDVVKVFRQYQPDVIITRFPPDARAGHGHHTGSAMLAQEAFDIASKADAFPEQVKEFGTWQVKRLYTNTGRWWNTSINEQTPGIVSLNVGAYNRLLGKSITEIAAVSSSQHKSQGWGRAGQRGYDAEFLEYAKGERAEKDLFEHVNTTWTRIKGGSKIQPLVINAIETFDAENPGASVPVLFQIRKEILALEKGVWRTRKLKEVEQLIQDCLGLYIEVKASQYWITPGEEIEISNEVINRSSVDVALQQISAPDITFDSLLSFPLKENISTIFKSKKVLTAGRSYSDPYWLREPHEQGLFNVTNKADIGKAQNDPAVSVSFKLKIGDESLVVVNPVIYKWTDPVKGELWRPVEIVPPLSVDMIEKVLVFSDDNPRNIALRIRSSSGKAMKGVLRLELPADWHAEPSSAEFDLKARGDERMINFKVFPGKNELTGVIRSVAEVDGKKYDRAVQTISYDHIPIQTFLPKAEAKVARMNLKREGHLIGYIPGAGDDIPTALRTMGFEVWEMKPDEINRENLKRVDAVVLGIRALNVSDRIRYFMPALMEYVRLGGALVVQYNTNGRLETDNFSPFPLSISRERVTDESAAVRILKPDHPLLTIPNKLSEKDFEGWVQERGLYFPDKWDANYEALLSMNDPGETAKDGGLLIARYGEGHYIYTGLSFFRQLPEGVPGAYKLFANLVSMGKSKKTKS
ncbi:MAG TPA: PIG-L family deacetylase [Chryseolinea sp.]